AANLVLADGRGGIGDVEVRPECTVIYDDDHADRRLHTNHYLTSRFVRFEDNHLSDSRPRLERIRALVSQAWGMIDVDTMKEFLADHQGDPGGICRHGERGMHSISGYIAEPAKAFSMCDEDMDVWVRGRLTVFDRTLHQIHLSEESRC
ncbi:MAG: hypothetical protein DMG05_26565, partial [Acidobacteria bacterium]